MRVDVGLIVKVAVPSMKERRHEHDRASERRRTSGAREGAARAGRTVGARRMDAGRGPPRPGRPARGAERHPRARPRAGPSRADDGLAVHVLPGCGEDHGG